MVKEIGSYFSLPLNLFFNKTKNTFQKGLFLSTGRDCLEYIIRDLNLNSADTVLFPSYLCASILIPFQKKKINVIFYPVNFKLEVDLSEFKRLVKKCSSALIINYFGFPQPKREQIKEICWKQGVILIEDDVQSFLTPKSFVGDYVFNSLRKALPLPDGAQLFTSKRIYNTHPITFHNSFYWNSYVIINFFSGILKNIYSFKFLWKKMFIFSEHVLLDKYPKPTSGSRISRFLVNRINFNHIIEQRKNNYLYIVSKIKDSSKIKVIYPFLSSSVCPLGLPILSHQRDELKSVLIKNKIYPPIHWSLPPETACFKEAQKISKQILTLPIDQRYSFRDLDRIINIILNFESENKHTFNT